MIQFDKQFFQLDWNRQLVYIFLPKTWEWLNSYFLKWVTQPASTWNLFVLYFWVSTLQNKAFSSRNKGHLGSRYV